jgi:hypothetical protein
MSPPWPIIMGYLVKNNHFFKKIYRSPLVGHYILGFFRLKLGFTLLIAIFHSKYNALVILFDMVRHTLRAQL